MDIDFLFFFILLLPWSSFLWCSLLRFLNLRWCLHRFCFSNVLQKLWSLGCLSWCLSLYISRNLLFMRFFVSLGEKLFYLCLWSLRWFFNNGSFRDRLRLNLLLLLLVLYLLLLLLLMLGLLECLLSLSH